MSMYSDLNIFVKGQKNIKDKTLFGLKNKSLSGRKGFTLVEMMVAVIILSIFIVAVGMILTSSWGFWNDGWQQVILQRDASYAFASIEKVVRSGSSATVLAGGTGLQVIKNGTSGWTKNFQSGGGVLQLVEDGETKNIVGGIQSINFAISGNTVLITLTLTDGSSIVDFRTTILLRNVL